MDTETPPTPPLHRIGCAWLSPSPGPQQRQEAPPSTPFLWQQKPNHTGPNPLHHQHEKPPAYQPPVHPQQPQQPKQPPEPYLPHSKTPSLPSPPSITYPRHSNKPQRPTTRQAAFITAFPEYTHLRRPLHTHDTDAVSPSGPKCLRHVERRRLYAPLPRRAHACPSRSRCDGTESLSFRHHDGDGDEDEDGARDDSIDCQSIPLDKADCALEYLYRERADAYTGSSTELPRFARPRPLPMPPQQIRNVVEVHFKSLARSPHNQHYPLRSLPRNTHSPDLPPPYPLISHSPSHSQSHSPPAPPPHVDLSFWRNSLRRYEVSKGDEAKEQTEEDEVQEEIVCKVQPMIWAPRQTLRKDYGFRFSCGERVGGGLKGPRDFVC